MEDGVWYGSGVGFIRLEDQEETFVVGCGKGGECGYFLKGLIVFYIGEF